MLCLPAPRIRGNPNCAVTPAVIYQSGPRRLMEPAPLDSTGQPDYDKLWGARILVTTAAGSFAVRDDWRVGQALALLARAGAVRLVGEVEQLGLWELGRAG